MATIPTVTFSRVLVGVDPSSESREAARQAAILADPGGSVMLLAAYDVAPGIVGGTGSHPPPYFDEDLQRERAEEGLARAREALTGLTEVAGKVARGNARDELLREIQREGHALVAVGSHGVGRVRGLVIGSTATEVVRKRRARFSSPERPESASRSGSPSALTARPIRPRRMRSPAASQSGSARSSPRWSPAGASTSDRSLRSSARAAARFRKGRWRHSSQPARTPTSWLSAAAAFTACDRSDRPRNASPTGRRAPC